MYICMYVCMYVFRLTLGHVTMYIVIHNCLSCGTSWFAYNIFLGCDTM